MAKNVLVVSTVEDADAALRAHFAEDDTIKVVVPVIGQGVLDWLANDQKAFGHVQAGCRTHGRATSWRNS